MVALMYSTRGTMAGQWEIPSHLRKHHLRHIADGNWAGRDHGRAGARANTTNLDLWWQRNKIQINESTKAHLSRPRNMYIIYMCVILQPTAPSPTTTTRELSTCVLCGAWLKAFWTPALSKNVASQRTHHTTITSITSITTTDNQTRKNNTIGRA